MKKQNRCDINTSVKQFKNTEEFFENLEINKTDFKTLSTPSKRGGTRGKTKQAWRTTDGNNYPVTTYKASELKEGTYDE
ncbi:hypothetical protein [Kurthia gibsonii]|uniref:hypothetical protein n=1 Tax=Kurthia gibsonii TaxID=33946 RepID=UPI002DBD2D55|nr:hypothetical protein [Kurthia gibsonii]MEB7772439.1 hypothetical protein [Kurthia gibsonii]